MLLAHARTGRHGCRAPVAARVCTRQPEPTLWTALLLGAWVLAASQAWAQAVDPRDRIALDRALNRTLEAAHIGDTTRWNNRETGAEGTIVVERTFYRDLNEPCRSYRWTLRRGDQALQSRGSGCRNLREDWTLQEDPPGSATAAGVGSAGGAARPPIRIVAPPPIEGPRETSSAPTASPPVAAAKMPPAERPVPMPRYTLPARTPL
jgi:surface antigen